MPLNYESVDFIEVLGKRRSCRFYDPERVKTPKKMANAFLDYPDFE